MDKQDAFILWFDQLSIDDVPLVGGKNASLGEMYRELVNKGVKVPNGFAVTAHAYHYFVEKAGIKDRIKEILQDLDTGDTRQLEQKGEEVRHTIMQAEFPQELKDAIAEAYSNLEKQYGDKVDVAVRSSATAEDLPDASFAGQQETYLNIVGPQQLLEASRKCMASLFTNRAISYRQDKGFDHFSIGLSIGVQKMIRSDKASSGVMFSIDTETGFERAVLVTGAYGLGENVVQGAVNPDEFYVYKPTLKEGYRPIIQRKLGEKALKMIYNVGGTKPTKNVPTESDERGRYCITDDEVLKLAEWACTIEDHYSNKRNKYVPMDMEWAKDGLSGELFIVQARPETVQSVKDKTKLHTYVRKGEGKSKLAIGKSVGSLIGNGKARVLKDVHGIHDFKKGEVLITEMTDPDWEPIMKIASAIVTNRGGRTCHAAIISREMGIPCVVGCGDATEKVKTGQDVTVDCSGGENGIIWEGNVPYEIEEHDLGEMPKTKTKIMMNLANPEQAFEQSFIPNSGVGLARMEFIVMNHIKAHPLALLHPDKVKDEDRAKIQKLTKGYKDGADYFVDMLAQGIGMLSAAFHPKSVILRFSDFKTNEYANLLGGEHFEPKEDNPMIGWRGASRYYNENYKEGFALECKAVKRVREEYGLKNLKVMVPFCRTLEEAHKVLDTMAEHGLKQHEDGLQVIGMCEIPSNVILADEFLDIFDGFSIGSNDLTQLALGVDRDSEIVSHVYDERNEAVKKLLADVIKVANDKGKYIGICGQAPSDFQDFALFLVEKGIQTMSLNPDTVIQTTMKVAEKEKELGIYVDQNQG
ncbi:phosphoenolpyruvate synthase [Candidatus Woesearchaeota archaeon]|nr:phosphoenolpyruvate synthase [Candidatus Woesearchaeota archaeon]